MTVFIRYLHLLHLAAGAPRIPAPLKGDGGMRRWGAWMDGCRN
jgi:hypothetical protein